MVVLFFLMRPCSGSVFILPCMFLREMMASWVTEKEELSSAVRQLVEGLSSIQEALGSNPSTTELQSQHRRGETRGSQVQGDNKFKAVLEYMRTCLKERKRPPHHYPYSSATRRQHVAHILPVELTPRTLTPKPGSQVWDREWPSHPPLQPPTHPVPVWPTVWPPCTSDILLSQFSPGQSVSALTVGSRWKLRGVWPSPSTPESRSFMGYE